MCNLNSVDRTSRMRKNRVGAKAIFAERTMRQKVEIDVKAVEFKAVNEKNKVGCCRFR